MDANTERILNRECNKIAKKIGKTIYHYTSFYALYSILENNELWLGNTANMNDKSELINFINQIRQVLEEKCADKQDEIDTIFHEIKKRLKTEYPFALCFSKNKDDAAQWERYADHAQGICIEFDTFLLSKYICGKYLTITDVFYDTDVRKHKFIECFTNYLDGKDYEFENLTGLVDNLLVSAASHKHHSFSSENECRIYTFYETETDYSKTEFKNINSQIKKMLILDLNKMNNSSNIKFHETISKIIVGPRSTQNIDDFKEFLKIKGCSNLIDKIIISECPLR